jgi:cardiolipin synthase
MTKEQAQLLGAVFDLAVDLPSAHLDHLATQLAGSESIPTREWFLSMGRTRHVQAKLAALHGLALEANVSPDALGLALLGACASSERVRECITEIVWTGPGTEAVPVRRVDQAMYELIEFAKEHILVVSYAAYRASKAIAMLQGAMSRGVLVDMVLERAVEAGGKLPFDTIEEVRAALPKARVLWWPTAKRPSAHGRPFGSMHVKCLVIDRQTALVSSANLTDQALEWNMELGVVIRGSDLPGRLTAHFAQLAMQGELATLP